MGLIFQDKKDPIVLTDIAGAEDHHGDMDFKVAGTKNGITAIQLDTKIDGLTFAMVEETLAKKFVQGIFPDISLEEPPSIQVPGDIAEDILSDFETMRAA